MNTLTYFTKGIVDTHKHLKEYVILSEKELEEIKIFFKNEEIFNSKGILENGVYIFVMNEYGDIFALNKQSPDKQMYKHPSLANKKEVAMAGHLIVEDGKLIHIDNYSGHYRCEQIYINQCLYELSLYIDISKLRIINQNDQLRR